MNCAVVSAVLFARDQRALAKFYGEVLGPIADIAFARGRAARLGGLIDAQPPPT